MGKGKLIDRPWKLSVVVIVEGLVCGMGYWLAFRLLPSNLGLYNAIAILFLIVAGITVIAYGNGAKNSNFYILGFAFLLLGVFVAIDRYEGFDVKISAFATLIMAFAAFITIYVSIDEGRRSRQDSIEREKREKKERLIDEVGRWLRELEGNILAESSTVMSTISRIKDMLRGVKGVSFQQWVNVDELDRAVVELGNINEAFDDIEYYQKLTSQLDEGLCKLIGVVMEKVKERGSLQVEYIAYLRGEIKKGEAVGGSAKNDDRGSERSGGREEDTIGGKLVKNARALGGSVQKALERVIEIKTSFVEVR